MQSIQDAECRGQLLSRLSQLSPESKALWGKFDAHRMICHLSDQLRVASAQIITEDRSSITSRTIGKFTAIYLPAPIPEGKIETDLVMLSTEPGSWVEDLETLGTLVDNLSHSGSIVTHPTFGPLSHSQWCCLVAKHMDHHLRQFGV